MQLSETPLFDAGFCCRFYQMPFGSVQWPHWLSSVLCTMQCSFCIVNVQSVLWTVHRAMCTVHFGVFIAQCGLFTAQCSALQCRVCSGFTGLPPAVNCCSPSPGQSSQTPLPIISIKKDNFCGDGADKTAVSGHTCFYNTPLVVLVQGMFWLNGLKCKCRCYHGVLPNDNDEIGWTDFVSTRLGFPLAKIHYTYMYSIQPSLSSTSVSFDVP